MSTATDEPQVTEAERRAALRISEAATIIQEAGTSAVRPDGTVHVHLIRPCMGKGKGRHIYEAEMLKRHASTGHFDDWPMFVDHESPEVQRKLGGLPRSLRDTGGIINETWWDDSVPADGRFGQGAVVASVKPVKWVRDLIEDDPRFAQVSLNTYASGVKPRQVGRNTHYVVEGFAPDGSADWVTKAGAGGKVIKLLEAEMRDEENKLLEAMSDDDLSAWLHDHRPAVAEAIRTPAPRRGEEETEVDPKEIREALHAALGEEDTQTVLTDAIKPVIESVTRDTLREVLPSAVAKAAEVIEAQATAAATNAIRLGRIRESAVEAVRGAKLPAKFEADVIGRVAVLEAQDTRDEENNVTETAEQSASKVVEAEIKRAQDLVASVKPTAVNGNGDGGEGGEHVRETADAEVAYYRHELKEAGIDVHETWGVPKDEEPAKPEGDKPSEAAAAA